MSSRYPIALLIPRSVLLFRVPLAAILVLMGACAPVPVVENTPAPDEANGHQMTVSEVEEPPAEPLQPTDPEVIYNVMAGEAALYDEDYVAAAGYYEKAAALSSDPDIAERATRIALYSGEPKTARDAVAQWLTLTPDAEAAHLAAARLYFEDENPDEAIPHLAAVIKAAEDADEAWQSVAQLLVSSSLGEKAIDLMGKVVDAAGASETPSVIHLHSQLAAQLGDVVFALVLADREIAQAPTAAAYAWRSRLNTVAGNTEAALEDVGEAVALEPEDRELRLQFAGLLQANDRHEEAQQQLIRLDADSDLLFTRAVYALGAENESLAESLYNELAEFGADDASHQYFLLGQLAELREQTDAARAWYLKVLPGNDYAEARMRLAVLLSSEERVDDALEVLLPLRHTRPREAVDAYLLEAQILQQAARNAEAFETLNRALAMFPEEIDLLYGRALAAEALDRIDIAEADLRRILDLEPENATALNALGYTLADRTERYQEAEALIARALAMRPTEAAIVDSMGWVKFKQGDYEAAEEFLRRALALQMDGEIAAHLGEVLWVQGRSDEAESIWLEALEQIPDSESLLETIDRLSPGLGNP